MCAYIEALPGIVMIAKSMKYYGILFQAFEDATAIPSSASIVELLINQSVIKKQKRVLLNLILALWKTILNQSLLFVDLVAVSRF